MDQTNPAAHLREVEERLAKSKRQTARQQEIITELQGDGTTLPQRNASSKPSKGHSVSTFTPAKRFRTG